MLSRQTIEMQLADMANDTDIQRELAQIASEFGSTESDGLDEI